MKTLVVTHVYQQAKPYLADLFESINAQTDKNFDLLAFNYGVDMPLTSFEFKGKEVSNTLDLGLVEARDWALRYALENGYELAIFIDADDVMAADRVAKTKEAFCDDIGFYYTKLNLLSDPSCDFFKGQLPAQVVSELDLIDHNFVGLSHFAINVKLAAQVISTMVCPSDVIAYDWFLASVLLLNGLKGKRVDSITYYRIYEHNTAGDTNSLTGKRFIRSVGVKAAHYREVGKYCCDFGFDGSAAIYTKKHLHYQELLEKIKGEGATDVARRLSMIKITNPFWWSSI